MIQSCCWLEMKYFKQETLHSFICRDKVVHNTRNAGDMRTEMMTLINDMNHWYHPSIWNIQSTTHFMQHLAIRATAFEIRSHVSMIILLCFTHQPSTALQDRSMLNQSVCHLVFNFPWYPLAGSERMQFHEQLHLRGFAFVQWLHSPDDRSSLQQCQRIPDIFYRPGLLVTKQMLSIFSDNSAILT